MILRVEDLHTPFADRPALIVPFRSATIKEKFVSDKREVSGLVFWVKEKRKVCGLIAIFYLVDRGLWHRLPGISSLTGLIVSQ